MHLGFDQVIAVDAIDHFFQMLITRRLTISIIYSSLYISFTCLSKTLNFPLVDVQLATLNWVEWFNKKRVHSELGYVSPFEFEAMYYDKINPLGQVA